MFFVCWRNTTALAPVAEHELHCINHVWRATVQFHFNVDEWYIWIERDFHPKGDFTLVSLKSTRPILSFNWPRCRFGLLHVLSLFLN